MTKKIKVHEIYPNYYLTIDEICEIYGFDHLEIYRRIYIENRKGQDIIRKRQSRNKKHHITKNDFLTVAQASKRFNISEQTIRDRLKRRRNIFKNYKKKARVYEIHKDEFLTQKEISKKYKIPLSTLSYRIRKNYRGLDLIKNAKSVKLHEIHDGEFLSITEISEKYKISQSTVSRRIKKGKKKLELIEESIFSKHKGENKPSKDIESLNNKTAFQKSGFKDYNRWLDYIEYRKLIEKQEKEW